MGLQIYFDDKFNEDFYNFMCENHYPDIYANLSSNPNISWNIIENNLDKPWDWENISCNLNINIDILKNNLDKPWNWDNLSRYINFKNNDDFVQFLDLNKSINWDIISDNQSLTVNIINNNLYKPWEWCGLALLSFSKNKNEEVLELFQNMQNMNIEYERYGRDIAWENLFSTGRISWEYISANLDKPWIKNNAFFANDITWDIIKNNPHFDSQFDPLLTPDPSGTYLSYNDDLNWEIIRENLHCFWDWDYISWNNNNITWDIIQNNLDIPWNWNGISCNTNITWDVIKNNLDKPWEWDYISINDNITWDIIRTNLDKPWNWEEISKNNPNITITIIKNNLDKPWNYEALCLNDSGLGKDLFIKNKIKEISLVTLNKMNVFNSDVIQYILNFL